MPQKGVFLHPLSFLGGEGYITGIDQLCKLMHHLLYTA